MLKQFFKDGVIYSISNMITRGISILLVPLYTRVLSPADYGIIDMVAVVTNLVNLTVALEITQGVARFFGECKKSSDKIGYASSSLWFTLCMYTIFAFFALLFPQQLTKWILGSVEQANVFKIVVASIWMNGIFYLLQNQLRWGLQSRECAVAGIVCSLFSIGVTVLCVVFWQLGVAGVFLGLLWGNLVGSILAFYYARHNFRLIVAWDKLADMLRFSIPLVPSSIGVFIALYIDRIAIKELLTFTDLGLYGIGYRVSSLVNLLMVGFQGALMPLVYTYYKEPDTPKELARIFRYFMAGALLLTLAISVLAREILIVFTTPDYYGAAVVIPILVPAVLLSGMYIFAPGLGIEKKTKVIAAINIFAAGLNTGLNFLLIPRFGIAGSALATLLSALSIFIVYLYYGQKNYYIPYEWRKIFKSVLFAVCLIGLARFINLDSVVFIIVCKAVLLLLGFGGVITLLMTREELQRVIHIIGSFLRHSKF